MSNIVSIIIFLCFYLAAVLISIGYLNHITNKVIKEMKKATEDAINDIKNNQKHFK